MRDHFKYLPLAYHQAGRSVWCLPHARTTHVFLPASIKPRRPNRWDQRATNYLGFWQRLKKNPYLTFAGIKHVHCRDDRLPRKQWDRIIADMQIDEEEALASDLPLIAAVPQPTKTSKAIVDPTAWQVCIHRGDVIEMRKADLCGLRGKEFPVYACAVYRECVQTRFCKKQSEKACYFCSDALASASTSITPLLSDVAVVIPTHNYGRFLTEAIESCLRQTTPPAEIIVIDDASDDDTAQVAASFADQGVRYERIEARSVYVARRRGMELTNAPFLIFLDADDVLGPNYIERGRSLFSDERLGLAWTDLQEFGESDRLRSLFQGDIERSNYIHAGAMVRRVALEQSEALQAVQSVTGVTADWFMWRQVLRCGWTDAKFDGLYRYRQHGGGMHLSGRGMSYFDEAQLAHETIPIILPLAGRVQWWDQLTQWVKQQTWPHIELIVIDSSMQPDFQRRVRDWLAWIECPTTYLPIKGIPGLADEDRTRRHHFRAVQKAMSVIYRNLGRTTCEYNLIVEDDVLPPDDAIEQLMRQMTARAACVSGVVRSRYQNAIIAWEDHRCHSVAEPRTGSETIYGSGFGCLLYRRSVFSKFVLHHGGVSGNFDHEVSHDVARADRDWLIDWDVHCVHAGLPAASSKGVFAGA